MKNSGFTILELLVVILALTILIGVVNNVFLVGFAVWNTGYSRSDNRTSATQALELISKNLRQATAITSLTDSSVTFTANLGGGVNTYRIYLYNAADPEPNPPYTQNTYDLRLAQGVTTYGQGIILARNIIQPINVPFAISGNNITIDLTLKTGDESIRTRTKVTPRNL